VKAVDAAERPRVTVLVPAWRERGMIARCLRSLQSVDYESWELIVVAGGPDGTLDEALQACAGHDGWRVIEQHPLGKNAALNAGLQLASSEIVVVLDADSVVGRDWLLRLVEPIMRGAGASTGKPVALHETAVSQTEAMERISALQIHSAITLNGAGSIALRRDVLQSIGGFPEDVKVGVDWDLDARLAALGIIRASCPDAIVWTERPSTVSEYWKNEVRWRRAHLKSLLRLRQQFMGNPIAALGSLYIYGLSWFVGLLGLASVGGLLMHVEGARLIIGAWLIVTGWAMLRRAALAVEVAAYEGDRKWLRYAWMPPCLLLMLFAAAMQATITLWLANANFKGPRMRAAERLDNAS
jgi:cellulose synthase/poly-beta-1,6-N-acetylglucosamine synthase-like glycosyltransferase